jgi:radical SAM protein with 4Fe4S-binding SPASM domain
MNSYIVVKVGTINQGYLKNMNKLMPYYRSIKNVVDGVSSLQNTELPLSIQVNLLNKCFQNCIGCRKPEWPDVRLKSECVYDIIHLVADTEGSSIVFSGGDPFYHENINDFVDEAFSYDIGIGILTAGLWRKDIDITSILKKVNWISISIDGASEEIYAKTRGVNTLNKVKENIKLLNDIKSKNNLNVRLRCNSTISSVNIYEMMPILKLCFEDLDIECNFYPMHTWDELKVQIGNHEEYIESCVEFAACYPIKKTNILNFESMLERDKPNLCIVPLVHMFIDANGDVLHCCRLANDNGVYDRKENVVVGNVNHDSISSIFFSDRNKKMFKETYKANYDVCKSCDRYNKLNEDYYNWDYDKVLFI